MNSLIDRLEPSTNGKPKAPRAADAAPQAAPPKPPPEGRDAGGRFAPGNRGGPGNPFARQVALLRRVFLEETTPERLRRIVRKMLDLAEEGDIDAAKFVAGYTLGKPTPVANPDRVDFDEYQRFEEATQIADAPPLMWKSPEPEFTLDLLRMSRERTTDHWTKTFVGGMSLTAEQCQKLSKLPAKKRDDKLYASYEKAKRRFDAKLERETKAAKQDPLTTAGEIRVAAPSPNGRS